MRILHLLASNTYSGAEHVVIDIIQSLKDQHEFVYVSPNGSIEQVLLDKKISFIGMEKFTYSEVYSAIRKYKPDIIHAHDYRASCISAFIPFKGDIISHIHNNNLWAKNLNLKTILYFLSLKRFSKVVVVSQPVIDEFIFSSSLEHKSCIISNVINSNEIFQLSKQDCDIDFLQSDILFVGRLTEQKNPIRFIKIIDQLKKYKPNVKAIMVGNGELKNECQDLIKKMNLENNIILLGFQSNPYIYMKNTKVLLIPSQWEGFGLVALEAMLLGIPVISTSVGGLKKIVGNFNHEWLCYSEQGFVEQILKIINSKSNTALKQSLIQYSEMINDFNSFVKKFDNLYNGENYNEKK